MKSLLLSTPVALLVALGGACGSLLRFLLVGVIRPSSPGFPAGTLAVNLLGCALIGVFAARLLPGGSPMQADASPVVTRLWMLLAVGVLGGFTTFSSLAIESVQLLRDGRAGTMLVYVLLSNGLGILAAAGAFVLFLPRGAPTP
ncbi:MAG: fluoride efflux transporter FluC [Phycisphaerales bacterium]|nr:CrcB family protein [Phycisphaeraceae bacterium]